MNFVVGLMLMYMEEEDAFWVLVKIVERENLVRTLILKTFNKNNKKKNKKDSTLVKFGM